MSPDPRVATLVFGLFDGCGLATKILDCEMAEEILVPNRVASNVGVEIGQVLAVSAILLVMNQWRRTRSFRPLAYGANVAIMTAGSTLAGFQLVGFFLMREAA